jgi:hypothetical protein
LDENGLLAAIRNFLSEKAPVNSEQLSFDDFGLIRPVFEVLKERIAAQRPARLSRFPNAKYASGSF